MVLEYLVDTKLMLIPWFTLNKLSHQNRNNLKKTAIPMNSGLRFHLIFSSV